MPARRKTEAVSIKRAGMMIDKNDAEQQSPEAGIELSDDPDGSIKVCGLIVPQNMSCGSVIHQRNRCCE